MSNSTTATIRGKNPKKIGPPDGGWGWVVVIASVFASLLGDGVAYSFGVLTTEFVEHYSITRSTVGWMGSVLVGVTLFSGPIVSKICDKWGYRVPTIAGSMVASIGFGAPFFYENLWFLVLMTSFIAGFGFGLIYLPSIIIVNIYFDKKKALALGIAVCGSGIGTLIFSPLIEMLLTMYGWQGAMLIVSGLLLNCVPCGLLYRALNYIEGNYTASNINELECIDEEVGVLEEEGQRSQILSTKEVLFHTLFLLFAICEFLVCVGFNAPFLYTKDRAIKAGISPYKSSFLISSIGLGNCFGRIIFGYIATKKVNRFYLYNCSFIISGMLLIVSWGARSYYWMIGYTFLFGLMTGTCVTLTTIILSDFLGIENLPTTFGLVSVFQGIAVFIGPPLAGHVYDISQSFDFAFAFCGGFMLLSGMVMNLGYLSRDFRKKVETFYK